MKHFYTEKVLKLIKGIGNEEHDVLFFKAFASSQFEIKFSEEHMF